MSGAGDPRGIRSSNAGGPAYDHPVSSHTQGQSQSRPDHRYSHSTNSTGGNAGGFGGAAGPAGTFANAGPNAAQGNVHEDGLKRPYSNKSNSNSRRGSWKGNSRSRDPNDSLSKVRCPKSPRGPFSPSPSLSRAAAAAAADAKSAGPVEDAVGTGGSANGREGGIDGDSGSPRRDASPSVNSVASLSTTAGKDRSADKAKKESFDSKAAEAYLQQTWNKIYPQLDDPDIPDHLRPVIYQNPRNAWKSPVRPMDSADFVRKVLASAGHGKVGS